MTKPSVNIMHTVRCGMLWACAFLFLSGTPTAEAEEAILQYFGTSWPEITERLPEVAEAGYTALWLPPPFKGGSGGNSVGYDPYDRFDLGTKNQMGSIPTSYGTEAELIHLVRVAHRFGLRVYFDNVMAHTGGPMVEGVPGTLHPNGFVPEDFHLLRNGTNQYQKAEGMDWNNEWQVLNRNPFGLDIAQEDPNTSFGYAENDDFPKWIGIRHPDHPEYYPDTDLPILFSGSGTSVTNSTYANKEIYYDIGYTNSQAAFVVDALRNGRFDWEDVNANGQHDAGEASEPFTDTGIDPSHPDRQNATWGYGDGVYNMGNPHPEDVNGMLDRGVRWFVDRVKADGFRLDAIKHVPDYFFGKQTAPKDASDEGYCGQIQAQYNITRGYNDWENHRDTVFSNTDPRNDALVYGEHLGAPPADGGYIDAGMRVANDNFLNAISGNIGSSLAGMQDPFYVISPAQSVHYILSHDNNYLSTNDREQAHAMMLAREGVQIVYTDGYNESEPPEEFPKHAETPFLGQFDNDWLPNLLDINRHFGWGYQGSRASSDNYSSFTRYDEDVGNDGSGVYMIFAMTKNYEPLSSYLSGSAIFPEGARLFNYSKYDSGNKVKVLGGNIRNMDGSQVIVPPNRYYAYSWRIPEMPDAWGSGITNEVQPIMIYENGGPAGTITVTRTDGSDGDPNFNPHNLPDSSPSDYSYDIEIPIITNPTSVTFVARSDGSAEKIMMKLDGGIDLNSQMSFISQTYGTRDNPPDQAKDRFLGFEEMEFAERGVEKFAAENTARNIIGSVGAETYICTIGNAGVTTVNGSGVTTTTDTADWVLHDPADTRQDGTTLQLAPAPESAAGQPISIAARLGYSGDVTHASIYYTTDGSDPEGSLGTGKGTTQVVEMQFQVNGPHDGTGIPEWWSASLPSLTGSTELRYKIAVYSDAAASLFPWSDDDIDMIPRMETRFEITGFNPSTVPNYPHNDWGEMAIGLEDGFHILRTKSLLDRTSSDADIYRENTQTFYLDKETPNGRFHLPEADGITIGVEDYGVVVMTDMTVEEVWYKIDDDDSGNDSGPNGNGSWALAQKVISTSPNTSGPTEQRWEFVYVDTPGFTGTADIHVILREKTSSTNLSLSDEAGHFTTLTRSILTDDSLPAGSLVITDPTSDGETLGLNSNLIFEINYRMADGVSGPSELVGYLDLVIDGQPVQPLSSSVSWWAVPGGHEITYALPNFYDGNPSFLHTLAIDFNRSGFTPLQATLQAYAEINEDSNNDGIPDLWELQWGLDRMDLSPGLDYDGDGVMDDLEYIADTDPSDTNAYFVIDSGYMTTNGDFSLVYSASSNREYYAWYTESLSTNPVWARYSEDPVTGNGEIQEYPVDISGRTNCFYKLEVALPE